jgi:hypothetical protein
MWQHEECIGIKDTGGWPQRVVNPHKTLKATDACIKTFSPSKHFPTATAAGNARRETLCGKTGAAIGDPLAQQLGGPMAGSH